METIDTGDLVRTYRDLGLLADTDELTYAVTLTGPDAGTWHPATVYCACEVDDDGTETVTVADILTRLGLDAADPDARTFCPDATDQPLSADLDTGDTEAVAWLTGARRTLHLIAQLPDVVPDVVSDLTHRHTTGQYRPGAGQATHPVVTAAVEEAYRQLVSALAEHGVPTDPEKQDALLRGWLPMYVDAAERRPDRPEGFVPGPTMLELARTITARPDHGRHLPADLRAAAWAEYTRVRVWRAPNHPEYPIYHPVVFAHDPATGLTLTPAVGDHRDAGSGTIVCVDDGYTPGEVATAWRTLAESTTGLGFTDRDRQVADYIAAYRAAS